MVKPADSVKLAVKPAGFIKPTWKLAISARMVKNSVKYLSRGSKSVLVKPAGSVKLAVKPAGFNKPAWKLAVSARMVK